MIHTEFVMSGVSEPPSLGDALLSRSGTMPELRIVRQSSLAEQVADAIVEGIASNILEPNERLVESDIAARFGVSRIPVREALKMLEVQGIVFSSPHRGVTVAEMDPQRILQVREIRTAIEKIIVREVAARLALDNRLLQRLDHIIEQMRERASLKDWSTVNTLDIAFHREMCAISGNRVAITLWEALARHTRIIVGRETRIHSDYSFIVQEHIDLRRALLDGNPRALEAEIERHINHSSVSGTAAD